MSRRKEIFFFSALVIATVFIYGQTISWIFSNWVLNPYLNYGVVVPFLSGYMVFREREKMRKVKQEYDEMGVVFVIAALAFYLVNIFLVKWLSLYLFVIGNLIVFYGRKRIKTIMVPLLFLLLATPIPDYLLEFIGLGLKQISVNLSISMISWFSDVSVVGDNVYLGDVSFYVGMPCSGLESFLGFGIFAVFFAYLFEKGKRRWILISSCLVATVFLNSMRMFIIFLVAMVFGETTAMGLFHTLSGTVLVAVYTAVLLVIYRRRI